LAFFVKLVFICIFHDVKDGNILYFCKEKGLFPSQRLNICVLRRRDKTFYGATFAAIFSVKPYRFSVLTKCNIQNQE